jgi:hypothetical protein
MYRIRVKGRGMEAAVLKATMEQGWVKQKFCE